MQGEGSKQGGYWGHNEEREIRVGVQKGVSCETFVVEVGVEGEVAPEVWGLERAHEEGVRCY